MNCTSPGGKKIIVDINSSALLTRGYSKETVIA